MRTYEVQLLVSGAIATRANIKFDTEKELNVGDSFRSDIDIRSHTSGVLISSTVYTVDRDRAYKVALLFISQMLDVLSVRINLPINIGNGESQTAVRNIVKAVVDAEEFKNSFATARWINLTENKLLRAFSWYRKGLYTVDPFDKFLAFWNSISVVADGYCNDNERTRLGVVNRIWDCFITIWGPSENWSFINGDERWINVNNDIRNKIAHGGVTVDIRYIDDVLDRLDSVRVVAYLFLREWAARLRIRISDIDVFN